MTRAELDLPNIQGFVVRGYRLSHARFLFLGVQDPGAAGAWLAQMTERVLTAAPWSSKPASGVNLAFTYAGLAAMGVEDWSLAGFPAEFRAGMASRAQLIGDVGSSAPASWETGPGNGDVHIMVMISARDRPALDAHDSQLREEIYRGGGLTIVADQLGVSLPDGRVHFDFADGLGQPALEGSGVPARPGQGAPKRGGLDWRAIRAGEFILGYPDEEGVLPTAPPPAALTDNGTFLVYRKLRQDVAAFRTQLDETAMLYGADPALLAAKVLGRWRDGTPLELSPQASDPALAADRTRNNAFAYGEDANGARCPVGSHIRRSNPRDSLPFEGALVNRHRLIRRGIAYGEPLPPGADNDFADRGLLFMCLQSSIQRQFEFVQSQWLNDGNALRLGADQDVLVGPQDGMASGKMSLTGDRLMLLGPLSRVVTTRGGEYFFVPGVNGLHRIAAASC